jgi:branched-chain amino acid transport system substrate-binding protein
MHRALLACALLCAAACKPKASSPPIPAAPVIPARIVVGASLPIGSAEGLTARFYREGYEVAFEEANHSGGVLLGKKRVPISLELIDDGDNPSKAEEQLRALLERKALFFLGSSSTRVVQAQSAIAERERVPYVTAAGADKALFERGYRYFFGLQAPIELLAYTQMRWIDEQQKALRLPTPLSLALLVQDSPRGREFRKGVVDFAGKTPSRRSSYRIIFDESFPVGAQDFVAPLGRVKAAHADVFLADGSLSEFLSLHRRYLWSGLCHKVVSYGAHGGEPQAQEEFGFDGLGYILSAVWWSPRLAMHGPNQRFVEDFKVNYHRDPDWYGALAYEAARALMAAISASGTADPEAVRAQLAAMRMESILPGGRLMFGADQQAIYPFVVQQNLPDGKAPVIYPNDVAESPGVPVNPKCR